MSRISSFVAVSAAIFAVVQGCSSSNGGSPSDGGESDVGSSDAVAWHREAGHPVDQDGGLGGGLPDASSGTCPAPADVSAWVPPALKPVKTSPGACSAQDISDFDAACLNANGSVTACTAFTTAHPACRMCLVSTSTDASWGPVVQYSGIESLNVAGCLSLVDAANAACARSVQNLTLCVHAACDPACPVTDNASYMLWRTCSTAAQANACSTYRQAATCSTMASGRAACAGASFEAEFLAIAPLFCGNPEAGAGEGGVTEGGAIDGGSEGGAVEAGAQDGPAGG
jgi:hypothetical protein